MDKILDEIQALRKELADLRNENIAMCRELARHHQMLVNTLNFFNGQHLNHHLTRLAGRQTAEFIVANMNRVKSFGDRATYLRYVIEHVACATGGGGTQYLEFGVFNGATINMISALKPDKIVYGFDSFEGLPETWRNGFDKAAFNRDGNLPQVNGNVRLVKGWFNETLPAFVKVHPEPCAFIHIDCDLYSSTKIVLDGLRAQIVSGTVIAFDEYFNYPGWQEGEFKAFAEFTAWNNLEFEYIARTEQEQVAVRIK